MQLRLDVVYPDIYLFFVYALVTVTFISSTFLTSRNSCQRLEFCHFTDVFSNNKRAKYFEKTPHHHAHKSRKRLQRENIQYKWCQIYSTGASLELRLCGILATCLHMAICAIHLFKLFFRINACVSVNELHLYIAEAKCSFYSISP